MPHKVLYCVITSPSNGGHGAWPAVILIDPDPVRAVETARRVEELGFRINWNSNDVRVERIMVGSVLTRERSKHGTATVYHKRWGRTHIDKPLEFLEYVYEEKLATALKLTVSYEWRPSVPIAR
jgi:hypothetical protein